MATSPTHTLPDANSQDEVQHCVDPSEDALYFTSPSSNQDTAMLSSVPNGQSSEFLSDGGKESGKVEDSGIAISNPPRTVSSKVPGWPRSQKVCNKNRSSQNVADSDQYDSRFTSHDNALVAGSLLSRSRRSSIFGSKMFESTSSIASQRVNVVAELAGIYPTLSGQYVTSDELRDQVNGFVNSAKTSLPFGHVSSSACLSDQAPADIVSLPRSASLPSRRAFQVAAATRRSPDVLPVISDKSHDGELDDGESELSSMLPPAMAASSGKPKWQNTMPELIEGPESETLTAQSCTRVDLAAAALAIVQEDQKHEESKDSKVADELSEPVLDEKAERRRYLKNLYVLSTFFFLIFTSYLSIRNLQSSLNAASGLGLYALSTVYLFLVIGSISATTIVQRLQPKRALTVAGVNFVVYNIANFYPHFYTLIPASAFVGFSLGVLWTAEATYLTNVSAGYAQLTGAETKDVLSRFHGILFAFYQFSQVAGGLISSLLLTSFTSTNIPDIATASNWTTDKNISFDLTLNETVLFFNGTYLEDRAEFVSVSETCGAGYCPPSSLVSDRKDSSKVDVDPTTVYLLMGTLAACAVASMCTLIFLLDPLDGITKKSSATVPQQLMAVFKFFADRRALCLAPLMCYSLVEIGFMFGEFAKAFVTCNIGVHMVGFLMVSISVSSAASSYFTGYLQEYVGRLAIIATALLMHLVLLTVMLSWELTADMVYMFFIIASLWGAADGVFIPQTTSILGILFPDKKEPAFASLKMCQAISSFGFFACAPYLCTRAKIFLIGGMTTLALIGYVALEIMLRIERRQKEDIDDVDGKEKVQFVKTK